MAKNKPLLCPICGSVMNPHEAPDNRCCKEYWQDRMAEFGDAREALRDKFGSMRGEEGQIMPIDFHFGGDGISGERGKEGSDNDKSRKAGNATRSRSRFAFSQASKSLSKKQALWKSTAKTTIQRSAEETSRLRAQRPITWTKTTNQKSAEEDARAAREAFRTAWEAAGKAWAEKRISESRSAVGDGSVSSTGKGEEGQR